MKSSLSSEQVQIRWAVCFQWLYFFLQFAVGVAQRNHPKQLQHMHASSSSTHLSVQRLLLLKQKTTKKKHTFTGHLVLPVSPPKTFPSNQALLQTRLINSPCSLHPLNPSLPLCYCSIRPRLCSPSTVDAVFTVSLHGSEDKLSLIVFRVIIKPFISADKTNEREPLRQRLLQMCADTRFPSAQHYLNVILQHCRGQHERPLTNTVWREPIPHWMVRYFHTVAWLKGTCCYSKRHIKRQHTSSTERLSVCCNNTA